jgi:two-component system sensor histidine kinase CpxA
MHRLFWKLFLSFWVALVLFAAGSLVAASLYLDQARAKRDATTPYEHAELLVAGARHAADTGGIAGLRAWARETDDKELVPILVLDREGHDLLDREVSARAQARWLRHRQMVAEPGERRADAPPPLPFDLAVDMADGREYWLVADFEGATLGRFLTRPRVLAVPLILGTLVAGLVCLLLARYLASPMERLRAATALYASGDFSHRVGPSLGGRRDELADLAFAMDHMAERLAALIESQRALLRDVSHELRSPLARLQAALGLVRQRGGTIADSELERFEREADRLSDLVGGILSFSRLDSGVQDARREPVSLDQMMRDVVADTQAEAENHGCTLVLEAPAEMPCSGDPLLLHSAFENVLRNAVRHAPQGSEVRVGMGVETGHTYAITVEDAGPGVPQNMLERIFEPFVRVDEAREMQSGGFGLGLAIARRAVLAHGGTIAARNRPAGGLAVTIRLPAA